MNNCISISAARRQGYQVDRQLFGPAFDLLKQIEMFHTAELKGIPVNYRYQKQLDCLTVFVTEAIAIRKTPKGNFILYNVNNGNAEEFKAISTRRIIKTIQNVNSKKSN